MQATSHRRFGRWTVPGLIVLLTLVAYLPALFGGFIWDDDFYVTDNVTLRTAAGLRRIWFEVGAVPQYYPLVHTTFWLERHLWGLNPFGYHLVNVLLHALGAILLGKLLERLRLPGAWLAAALFALHPLQVESVAWITERKNVLSGVFYFAAALMYARFAGWGEDRGGGSRRWYAAALLCFIAALLSKTVTCSLPVALLLVGWWQAGRVQRADVWRLVPFFVIGAALGSITVWVEKHQVGAQGVEWSLSFVERCLIAGRALWFYAGKIIWPARLTFIYPRWQIAAQQAWPYLFPLAALAVIVVLWRGRNRWGRGPLTAVLLYAGTLGPALGFVDVFPMRYSFVADHFAYLASVGLIVLAAAAIERAVRGPVAGVAGAVLVLVLGGLTWRQTRAYADPETLWRDTLRKNPGCWMAHNNLGILLAARNEDQAAWQHYREALRLNPQVPDPHNNLGNLLRKQGRTEAALQEYVAALVIQPGYIKARYNLAVALAGLGRTDAARARYREVIELDPRNADAHYNLGIALGKAGQYDQAIAEFQTTTTLRPDQAEAWYNLGFAYRQRGEGDRARPCFERALAIDPEFAAARRQLERQPP